MGSVNQARMLTLARRVARPLSSQSRRSFPLRLSLVMPRAQPLEIHRSVIVTRFDMVTVRASCGAARAVMQQRFAPATSARADEGAALIPIGREPRRPVTRLPRHGHSSCSHARAWYDSAPAPVGAERSGGQVICADTVIGNGPLLTRGATLGEYAVTPPRASDATKPTSGARPAQQASRYPPPDTGEHPPASLAERGDTAASTCAPSHP